jgi:hypothetical protein
LSGTTPEGGGMSTPETGGMSVDPGTGASPATTPSAGGTAGGAAGATVGTAGAPVSNISAFDSPVGELNTLKMPLTNEHVSDLGDFFDTVGYASTRLRTVDVLGPGPFKAVCLRTIFPEGMAESLDIFDQALQTIKRDKDRNSDNTKDGPTEEEVTNEMNEFIAKAGFVVVARVPELHQMLPTPVDEDDLAAISAYPKFMQINSTAFAPAPGDIVWVNYTNLETFEGPVYHGVINKAGGAPMPIANGSAAGSVPAQAGTYQDTGKKNSPLASDKYFGTMKFFGKRKKKIDMIVLHDGGSWGGKTKGSIDKAISSWNKGGQPKMKNGKPTGKKYPKVSSHYWIERDGTIHQLLAEESTAWHTGTSSSKHISPPDVNSRSVGVDLEQVPWDEKIYNNREYKHSDGSTYTCASKGYAKGYSDQQHASLQKLLKDICARHGLDYNNETVQSHAHLVGGINRGDPIKGFDWGKIGLKDIMMDAIGVKWGHHPKGVSRGCAEMVKKGFGPPKGVGSAAVS